MKMRPIYPHQLRCAGGIIMWMPTLGHSSNHKGYNTIDCYNRQDCSRTPTAQATGLKDGKCQFHWNPWNWHLQFLRSVWDCQHHADQPATLHHLTWKGGVTGVLIAPIGQCHWEKTPVSTKIKSRQNLWKNFLISRDALNAFGDAPTILMGKALIQAPAFRYIPKTSCL